jgi:hypothetical protein
MRAELGGFHPINQGLLFEISTQVQEKGTQ